MDGGERKYYDGPSAPPAVIIRFLKAFGFQHESRANSRCYFRPTRTFETSFAPPYLERIQFYPLLLPHPRPGQEAIPGGTIDMNVFVNGIERGLLPEPSHAIDVWNEVYQEVMADEKARIECLVPRSHPLS